jgi:hypothetical protein
VSETIVIEIRPLGLAAALEEAGDECEVAAGAKLITCSGLPPGVAVEVRDYTQLRDFTRSLPEQAEGGLLDPGSYTATRFECFEDGSGA